MTPAREDFARVHGQAEVELEEGDEEGLEERALSSQSDLCPCGCGRPRKVSKRGKTFKYATTNACRYAKGAQALLADSRVATKNGVGHACPCLCGRTVPPRKDGQKGRTRIYATRQCKRRALDAKRRGTPRAVSVS